MIDDRPAWRGNTCCQVTFLGAERGKRNWAWALIIVSSPQSTVLSESSTDMVPPSLVTIPAQHLVSAVNLRCVLGAS